MTRVPSSPASSSPTTPPIATPTHAPTASCGAAQAAPAPVAAAPTPARTGLLRSGNPSGNPDLAPRCGAKARTTGCPCRAPAMANGRCRMHGGASKAPSPALRAKLAALHTTHGGHTAAKRAEQRYVRTLIVRTRLLCAARKLMSWLPPDMARRLKAGPDELAAPIHPSNAAFVAQMAASLSTEARDSRGRLLTRNARGRFAAAPPPPLQGRTAERAQARTEAAALAPWRACIRAARQAAREARAARRAARGQSNRKRTPPGTGPAGGNAGGAALASTRPPYTAARCRRRRRAGSPPGQRPRARRRERGSRTSARPPYTAARCRRPRRAGGPPGWRPRARRRERRSRTSARPTYTAARC